MYSHKFVTELHDWTLVELLACSSLSLSPKGSNRALIKQIYSKYSMTCTLPKRDQIYELEKSKNLAIL